MIRFDNVSYAYPFQTRNAVENISFSVAPGEIVLCTGVSGCGKSTLMRLANGLCPHYYKGEMSGVVSVNAIPTTNRELHEIADDIGTLFQNPEEQFFALNVEDELAFAHEWRGRTPEETGKRLRRVTEEFSLGTLLESSVNELSEGQKQKVGLAAILSQEPRALILDEPTANLDPEATAELAEHLVRLKKAGAAILVVDHRLYWLREAADRVIVMSEGRIAEQGEFSLLADDALRAAYGLRRHEVADARQALPALNDADARLVISDLTFAYKNKAPIYSDASCAVGGGVTAIVGENGAGKTTMARLLTGLIKAQGGTLFLDGEKIGPDALLKKSSIVLQNADHQLYMRTALEEIVTCLEFASNGAKPSKEDTQREAMALLEAFALQHLAERHPQSLSGGEKQRLVIACALAKKPGVLILDEPTSGLDGRNMERIATALEKSAESGACVLVITHDLELMGKVCKTALRLPLQN
ncbi:MAG: Putative HMP/thiamine import ATP-binding protein YkoD [Desulfovibrio sp.]